MLKYILGVIITLLAVTPSYSQSCGVLVTNPTTGRLDCIGSGGGSTGAGYLATSSTSLTTGAGSKTFTTQSGLAYSVGACIALVSAGTPADYMIGRITAYSGGSMTFTAAAASANACGGISGSGTHADWNIGLMGLVGSDGAIGPTGAGIVNCAPASASTTAYTCSPSPVLSAYTTQQAVAFVPDVTGAGGATTVNISGLGAKSIKLADGTTNPTSSSIIAGSSYLLYYDGTNFRLYLQNPWGNISGSTGVWWLTGSSSAPSINVASCSGATIDSASTNLVGKITGLPTGTCTIVLTFANSASATNGWHCPVSDQTTANLFRVTASNATTVTFSGISVSGDVLVYGPCGGY